MDIIFFGTPIQARHIADGLYEKGISIKAVVTQPDRPIKRSKKPAPSSVKTWAIERAIPVLQPEKLSDNDFIEKLSSYSADCFIVTAYGAFLPKVILDLPEKGCINVHPSLLPKYRGAAPIPWAVINGDQETGVSIMAMVKKMDAGDVYRVEKLQIGINETCEELEKRIWPIGVKILYEELLKLEDRPLKGVPQDENLVSFAPKLSPELAKIDWSKDAAQIHNLIRGLSPKPAAWTEVLFKEEWKRFKIYSTVLSPLNDEFPLGSVYLNDDEGPAISCNYGALILQDVQLEGKKRLSAREFFRGIILDQFKLKLTN